MTEIDRITEPVQREELPTHPGLTGRVNTPPGVNQYGQHYPAALLVAPRLLDEVYFNHYLASGNRLLPRQGGYINKPRPTHTTREVVASISARYEEAMDYKTKGFFCYGAADVKADPTPVESIRIGHSSFLLPSADVVKEKYVRVPLDRRKQPWVLVRIEGRPFYYPESFGQDFVKVISKLVAAKKRTGTYPQDAQYSTGEIAGGEYLREYVNTIQAKKQALLEAEPAVEVTVLTNSYTDFFTGNTYNDHNGAAIMWKGEALRACFEGAATTGEVVRMWTTAKASERFWLDTKPGVARGQIGGMPYSYPFYVKPEHVEAVRAAGVGITDEERNKPFTDNDSILSSIFDAYTPEPDAEAVERYKQGYLETCES